MDITTFSEPTDACNRVVSARAHIRQARCLLLSLLADSTNSGDALQINMLLSMNVQLQSAANEVDALVVWAAAL